ncbi:MULTISPECIES: hypothetical protein [unclassified Meiothermus]|uniref:hypothetical protein n=1 Tax=unclassified Meiothermus TaxID=370471 RepID=UPI000D7BB5E0|nr:MULTISPECIES: hypothetical protein [unclassified Meiothermus]PZA08576.1 hypothetical protein DNA98_00555 [Meiothermus sp. Pnk-1]RYM40807.1 hypothetical protein EWH23_01385 [Meiothermus sp. PNK-Is4]
MDPYREYQDYVVAHRLRAALGQPTGRPLPLSEYARLRLRRSELVRRLVARQGDPYLLAQIEQLTEELNYGFWSNPTTMKAFLRRFAPLRIPALSSPQDFEGLLTQEERSRLPEPGLAGRYYLGWLRLPQLVMEPLAFEQAMREQEVWGERLGLFLDVFHQVPRR